MSVTGAHFDLKPGNTDAMVLHWVFDPRRSQPGRVGAAAGPSIEDASVVSVNLGVEWSGPFPQDNNPEPALADLYATISWSSGGKDVQTCEVDLVNGTSISFAATRAEISASYVTRPGVDKSLLPVATINVTMGRLPSGKQARRSRYYGLVDPGVTEIRDVPPFAESLVVLSSQIPEVVRADQIQGSATLSRQNIVSQRLDERIALHSLAEKIALTNNGAAPAILAVQYLLNL